jgi:hypothetical protein
MVGVGVGGADAVGGGGATSAEGTICLAGPLSGVRGGVEGGVEGFEVVFAVTLVET